MERNRKIYLVLLTEVTTLLPLPARDNTQLSTQKVRDIGTHHACIVEWCSNTWDVSQITALNVRVCIALVRKCYVQRTIYVRVMMREVGAISKYIYRIGAMVGDGDDVRGGHKVGSYAGTTNVAAEIYYASTSPAPPAAPTTKPAMMPTHLPDTDHRLAPALLESAATVLVPTMLSHWE